MLSVKANPVGVDVPIRKLQEALHRKLFLKWGLDINSAADLAKYEAYGRCYRNHRGNGYIAEVYTSSNEYKEVYWNDALSAISFFGMGTEVTHGILEEVDIHLVFFVNLAKLKPSVTGRADEEVRKDVTDVVGANTFGFSYESLQTGIENVLREYPGSYRDNRLKHVDMHPVHCFRLNFKLSYNKNSCF